VCEAKFHTHTKEEVKLWFLYILIYKYLEYLSLKTDEFVPPLGIVLFTTTSRTALGPTQPPVQWVLGALSLGVKRPERGADHSPQSGAEAKNAWNYTSTPAIHLHGVVLS
jgi:hypothetical protein